MDWAELYTRSGQALAKRWDVVQCLLGADLAGPVPAGLPATPGRFFFEPGEVPGLVAILRQRLPDTAERIVVEARRICEHRFGLLGYEELNYGREIDWHLDPVHGKRAPRRLWFKIRFLDFAEVGDHKIIWELNRHQHLVTLAKAWGLTGEERFVTELLAQWYHWQQENPYLIGVNWASALEVAFRSLSWLWVRSLLGACPTLPERFSHDLLRALARSGRYIERYLSTYFAPNTHLLGEGVALFCVGLLCPQLPAARRWRERGWEIVLRQAERQVRSDGMHFEQSVYYHVYALDFFLHARLLAARNRISVPVSLDRTIEKMLDALCALSQAGVPPRFGDDDGGRVFDPRRNRPEHMTDPLSTGAVLFDRPDFKFAARSLQEETLWLCGAEGAARFDEIPSERRPADSVRLEASGIYALAGSERAHQLFIDAGVQGAGTAGHGHADALSVQLVAHGQPWLVDPGTFCYVSPGVDRDRFRGTAAHNTMQVDGASQAAPAGPFAWGPLPEVCVEQWIAGQTFDLFAGRHTGYRRLPQPVHHRRWIFGLKSQFWLVRDIAIGAGQHRLDLFWHLAPDLQGCAGPGEATVLLDRDNHSLALLPLAGHGWSQELERGEWSPAYGRKEPGEVLHFSTETQLPAEFVVLLLPLDEAHSHVGVLTGLEDSARGPSVRGYCYSGPRGSHYLFFAEHAQPWSLGPWASDARFVYCGVSPGEGKHLILCGGSYLEIGARRVVACKLPVSRCEILSNRGETQIYCPDESAGACLQDDTFEIVPA